MVNLLGLFLQPLVMVLDEGIILHSHSPQWKGAVFTQIFAVLGLERCTHSWTRHFQWGFTAQRQKVSQGGQTVDIPVLGAEINLRQSQDL